MNSIVQLRTSGVSGNDRKCEAMLVEFLFLRGLFFFCQGQGLVIISIWYVKVSTFYLLKYDF